MTRCSQPLAGFSTRCMEDEQMLQAILRANPKSAFMYVVDTRPKVRAYNTLCRPFRRFTFNRPIVLKARYYGIFFFQNVDELMSTTRVQSFKTLSNFENKCDIGKHCEIPSTVLCAITLKRTHISP